MASAPSCRISACISELTATCENLMDKEKSLDDCIQWIRQSGMKNRLKDLCDRIKDAQDSGDDSKVVELVTEYNDTIKVHTEWAKKIER